MIREDGGPNPTAQYWPPEALNEVSVAAFVNAFETLGYVQCADGSLETSFEKVAIYVNRDGAPTHAARQLRNGKWTSKLGGFEDITHDTLLDVADGPAPDGYGRPEYYLKRRRRLVNSLRRKLLWLLVEVWERRVS